MKHLRLVSISAAVLLAALSLNARAEEPYGAPPATAVDGGDWPAEAGFAPYSLRDRLDAVRHHYTGALMRFRLASALSAQETAIGIRPDQQAAWRTYTNALLALIPKREVVLSLIGVPDGNAEDPEAFERAEALADALKAYAAKADSLKAAITALRATLTPEQIEAARLPRFGRG